MNEVEEIERRYRAIQEEQFQGLSLEGRRKIEREKERIEGRRAGERIAEGIKTSEKRLADPSLGESQREKETQRLEYLLRGRLHGDISAEEYDATERKLKTLLAGRLTPEELAAEDEALATKRQQAFTSRIHEILFAAVIDGSTTAVQECCSLAERLLTSDTENVESHIFAAKVCDLCGDVEKAALIVNDIVARRPDDKMRGIQFPVGLAGGFWAGTLYKRCGKAELALGTYESLQQSLGDQQGKEFYQILCRMYEAEVYSTMLKNKDRAIERLESIAAINMDPKDSPNDNTSGLDVFKNWALYFRDRLQGETKTASVAQPDKSLIMWMYPYIHAQMVGIINEPEVGFYDGERSALRTTALDRAIENGSSVIDREMSQLAYGVLAFGWFPSGNSEPKSLQKAEKHLFDLFKGDSFWAPVAGMSLAYGQAVRGKTAESDATYEQVKQRFPEYESLIEQSKQSLAQQPPRKR